MRDEFSDWLADEGRVKLAFGPVADGQTRDIEGVDVAVELQA